MQTTYQLNADELNSDFVESLKALFRHKQIQITVQETDNSISRFFEPNEQTTAAMLDVRAKKNLHNVSLEQLQQEIEVQ